MAEYGTQDYGSSGGYGQDSSYGGQGTQGQGPKKGTGIERKNLLDTMDIGDKTKLTDVEKCKTKCEMTFVQCYRIQSDRSKCYSTQQECLDKCGGGQGGEDTSQSSSGSDYGSPSGGVLEFK